MSKFRLRSIGCLLSLLFVMTNSELRAEDTISPAKPVDKAVLTSGTIEPAAPISWGEALLIFVIAGSVGGALATLRLIDAAKLYDSAVQVTDRGKRFGLLTLVWLLHALSGIGGAVAALFFLLLAHQVRVAEGQNQLQFATWGFVAGFIGLQLLNLAAQTLTKTIEGIAEKKAVEVSKSESEGLRKEVADTRRELAIRAGLYAQGDKATDEDIKDAEDRLRAALKEEPWYRRLIIVLGNLLGLKRKLTVEAMQTLTDGLENLKKKDPDNKVDQGAILYNLSFYTWRRSEELPAGDVTKDTVRKSAFTLLKQAVTLDPSLKTDAAKDPDFQPLWTDPDFLAAIQ